LGCGGSALVFTQTHKDLGHPPSRQHIAIDGFQNGDFFDGAGVLAVERAGLSPYLDFREDRSRFALPTLLREGHKFRLIYIDGSHFFDDVLVDLCFSVRLLEVGGVVLLDDSSDREVWSVVCIARKLLRQYLSEVNYRHSEISNRAGAWPYTVDSIPQNV
jgi:Methyltransferase domain